MKFKTVMIKLISVALAVSMLTVCSFAADRGTKGGRANGGNRPEMQQGEKGERPERGSRERMTFDGEKIITMFEEQINTLEDGDAKTELLSLIEKLKAAIEEAASYKDSTGEDAKQKLKELNQTVRDIEKQIREALIEAGISNGNRPKQDENRRPNGENNRFERFFDSEKIAELIEAVESEETKATLNTLLESYKTAAENLKTAMNDKAETIDELRETCSEAYQQLLTALEEAGIDRADLIPERPDNAEGKREPKKPDDNQPIPENNEETAADTEATAESSDNTAAVQPAKNQSLLSKILGLFGLNK